MPAIQTSRTEIGGNIRIFATYQSARLLHTIRPTKHFGSVLGYIVAASLAKSFTASDAD